MKTSPQNKDDKTSPAPWKANEKANGQLIIEDANGITVCEFPSAPWIEIDEENARLILAVPELITALRAAVANEQNPTGLGIGAAGLEFKYPEWVEQALDAIAKAEGRS